MLIIDTHTHIFPDNAAARILESTKKKFKIKVYGKGTATDLISRMNESNITYAAVHMVAVNPRTVKEINTWLIGIKEPRFIKFGTIHPSAEDFKQEVRRLKENGVTGIKLQPNVQGFDADDDRLTYPLYEALVRNGMMVMFHVGGDPVPHARDRSKPDMILRIAQDFPELKIIAAHLGGLNMWTQVAHVLAGQDNVYMETSMTYGKISPKLAETIIRKHGCHKIFFGTDYPFAPVKDCVNRAMDVSFLSEREKEEVMGLNARQLFQPEPTPFMY